MADRYHYPLSCLFLSCAMAAVPAPAFAGQDGTAELDRLALASVEPAAGLTLAREEAAAGDLLAALATLERVLFVTPGADEARLLHLSLLCRLDDRGGAQAELAELAGRDLPDAAWAEVEAACGPLERPSAAGTGGAG